MLEMEAITGNGLKLSSKFEFHEKSMWINLHMTNHCKKFVFDIRKMKWDQK